MSNGPKSETDDFGEVMHSKLHACNVEWWKKLAEMQEQRDEAREQLNRICRDGFRYQDTIGLEPCADYALRKLKEERRLARELRDALADWHCLWRDRLTATSSMTFAIGYPIATKTQQLLTKAKEVLP